MFIAIAMTLILFNEFIGDNILDTVIPSVYSGIMLLGVSLYNISLATLLISTFVVIAVFVYFVFIYFPSRHAYQKRVEKLSQTDVHAVTHSRTRYANNNNRRPSSGSSLFTKLEGYFSRLYRSLKHSIQYAVTFSSFYYIVQEKQKRQLEIIQWRDMNMILPHQGYVQTEKENDREEIAQQSMTRRSYIVSSTSISSLTSTSFSYAPIPAERMKGTILLISPLVSDSNPNRNDSVFHENGHRNGMDGGRERGERVITYSDPIREKRKIKSSALYDSTIAMQNMRLKFEPVPHLDVHEKDLDVPLTDLLEEFKNLLSIFAPDGILMTKTERLEAVDSFIDWKESRVLRIRVTRVRDEIVHTQLVNFFQFEEWFKNDFLHAMHKLVVDRFIDHALQFKPHVKKRVSRALLLL
jgi:hypothetical protein